MLKKITWEEVKLVSVDVSHDDKAFAFFWHLNQLSFALEIIDPGISLHEQHTHKDLSANDVIHWKFKMVPRLIKSAYTLYTAPIRELVITLN